MNTKDAICEIFVLNKGEGQLGSIGTGYRISHNLILTAAHILTTKKRDETKPIQVCWHHHALKPNPSVWTDVKQIHILSEKLDVALVECDIPTEVRSTLILSEQWPEEFEQWSSEGFARAGGRDDKDRRRSFALQGTVLGKPTHSDRFQLSNIHAPAEGDKWRGISGSPVIIGNRIAGVIVSHAGETDCKMLEATPVAAFIDHPKFRELLGYDEKKDRRQAFEHFMIDLLKPGSAVVEALKTQIPCVGSNLHEQLLQLDIGELLEKCTNAYRQLEKQQNHAGCTDIAKLLNCILPALYDHGIVEHIRQKKMDIHTAIFNLPVGVSTLAGVIMAGVDRKPFKPRARKNKNDFPDGRYAIPHAPEMGFDETGEKLGEAWKAHITHKFLPGHEMVKSLQQHWHQYMTRNFAMPSDADKADVRAIAADELAFRADEEGETYYFVIDAKATSEEEEQQLQQVIHAFKKDYPAIVFVRLDEKMLQKDKKTYRKYRNILPYG